jgi:FtsH-binding integral membrane protein
MTNVRPNDSDPLSRAQAPVPVMPPGQLADGTAAASSVLRDQALTRSVPREGFLAGSVVWMFVGVLLSAASAAVVMGNTQLQQQVIELWLPLLIGQLVLVIAIGALVQRIPPIAALGLFFVYALTMGLTIGVIVLAYVGSIGISGVVSAFAGAAGIFGGAALYGVVTKRDLTSLGGILFMGLIGLVVVSFLQLFFFADSNTASLVIGILGVVIFTGLTAWDVQRLKNGAIPGINKDSATVLGALTLYLDFVNLFLMLLRIFGSSR